MTSPRRFRFTLRTLFVVLTLLCLWLGYYAKWAHSRRAARSWIQAHMYIVPDDSISFYPIRSGPTMPWPLRLFGEQPWEVIELVRMDDAPDVYARQIERIRALFPEADVSDMTTTK